MTQKEKFRLERHFKIERYKNKKRNWIRKIAYDCRKRVADSRLRIKGRFISKKDSEKIQKLVGGKQEEAFNEKKKDNYYTYNDEKGIDLFNIMEKYLGKKITIIIQECKE